MNTIVILATSVAVRDIDSTKPLDEQFRQAAASVKANWMGHSFDHDAQFRAAVGAVLLKAQHDNRDDDVRRIKAEVEVLKIFAAAASGVPVDFDSLLQDGERPKAIGMAGIWREMDAAEAAKVP